MGKKWEKPALVVLYRGRPEEVLTTGCKSPAMPSGAMSANNKCDNITFRGPAGEERLMCWACQGNNVAT